MTDKSNSEHAGKGGEEDRQEGESQATGDVTAFPPFILCGTDAQIWGKSFFPLKALTDSSRGVLWKYISISQYNQIDNQDKPNNQT